MGTATIGNVGEGYCGKCKDDPDYPHPQWLVIQDYSKKTWTKAFNSNGSQTGFRVYQIDPETMEVVADYLSIQEASRDTRKGLTATIMGLSFPYYSGYFWSNVLPTEEQLAAWKKRYEKEKEEASKERSKYKLLLRHESGKEVIVFSAEEASEIVGRHWTAIHAAMREKRKTSNGWTITKLSGSSKTVRYEVRQYSEDGTLLATWPTIQKASLSGKVTAPTLRVVRSTGSRQKVNSFYWEVEEKPLEPKGKLR